MSACWTGWSRLFLLASSVCCGVPARHNRLRHSGCPAQQRRQAEQPTVLQCPASTLSFSQYNYHIITLQDWTVCLVKYRGASDVSVEMKTISPRREKIEAGSSLTKYHHHHSPASLSPLHPPVAGHPWHQHQVTTSTGSSVIIIKGSPSKPGSSCFFNRPIHDTEVASAE